MRVELSTFGKFHTFDLARQLNSRGVLQRVYSGYPKRKLRNEGLPSSLIRTMPFFIAPLLAASRLGLVKEGLAREWDYLNAVTLGRWVSSRIESCDVFIGLSASGLEAGEKVRRKGGVYLVDRGSAHIRQQDNILRDEHAFWSMPYPGIHPGIIDREEREYAAADAILVPSQFASRSFEAQGIPAGKVHVVPYGVDLARFAPEGGPDPSQFSVLFVGQVTLQKGIPYLLESFRKLRHPRKRLRIVGSYDRTLIQKLSDRGLLSDGVTFIGPVNQSDLRLYYSTSDVLVLPSVQDGFGMVMAQAMACGCPVIASANTGAADLYTPGEEGFIVPIRDSDAITAKLDWLASNADMALEMRNGSLRRVRNIEGWDRYGNAVFNLITRVLDERA